jgi:hypothetical protein
MRRHTTVRDHRAAFSLLLTGGISLLACIPPVDPGDTGLTTGAGGAGVAGTGGSGATPPPAPGGTGGVGAGGTGGGGVAGSRGAGGAGGGPSGAAGGAAGSAPGGSGGSARADAGGASRADAGPRPSDAAPAAPTFTRIYNEILTPGCTAPNNACHSVPRDQYFLFAEGAKDRSYMLLINEMPRMGTIPGRVNTLLSYVTPQNGNPVRMPPQSGENLGNPPIRKPPLTMEQIQTIRTWASSGARND